MIQLTKDDTLVQLMIDENTLTKEEAKVSKYRSVLIQAIGSNSKVLIKTKKVKLPNNYKLFMCSDGVTGALEDECIYDIIMEENDIDEKCVHIIDKANHLDGSDNCSVIIIEGVE